MYGSVSPDAIVESISLGTPTGSARIAPVATDVFPDPPSPRTPASSPDSKRSVTTAQPPRPSLSSPHLDRFPHVIRRGSSQPLRLRRQRSCPTRTRRRQARPRRRRVRRRPEPQDIAGEGDLLAVGIERPHENARIIRLRIGDSAVLPADLIATREVCDARLPVPAARRPRTG